MLRVRYVSEAHAHLRTQVLGALHCGSLSGSRTWTKRDSTHDDGRGELVARRTVLSLVQVLYVYIGQTTPIPQRDPRPESPPVLTAILRDQRRTWSEVVDGGKWRTRPASTVQVLLTSRSRSLDPEESVNPTRPSARNRGRAPVDLCETRRVARARRGHEEGDKGGEHPAFRGCTDREAKVVRRPGIEKQDRAAKTTSLSANLFSATFLAHYLERMDPDLSSIRRSRAMDLLWRMTLSTDWRSCNRLSRFAVRLGYRATHLGHCRRDDTTPCARCNIVTNADSPGAAVILWTCGEVHRVSSVKLPDRQAVPTPSLQAATNWSQPTPTIAAIYIPLIEPRQPPRRRARNGLLAKRASMHPCPTMNVGSG